MDDQATTEAEALLLERRARHIENEIHPSQNRIIDRLLRAKLNMGPVYAELWRKLRYSEQRDRILDALTLAVSDPDYFKDVRDQLDRAERFNEEIAEKARELAQLLRDRRDSCLLVQIPDDHHPIDLIERAARNTCDRTMSALFSNELKQKLSLLRGQFDLKYWPSTDDVLDALADAQEETPPGPREYLVSAAIDSRSQSDADMVRALLLLIGDMKDEPGPRPLPRDFSLTDGSLALFMNAALESESFNAERVRGIRRRMPATDPDD